MLTQAQLRNAVHRNSLHAKSLQWEGRVYEIASSLGVITVGPMTGPEDPGLAQGVERFQAAHPPLERDGILGPKTWPVLKRVLDAPPAPLADPEGPPAKGSKATPETVKALDNWLLAITHGHPKAVEPWTFYEKVDKYLGPFGPDGYPIGYGKKYCVLFNNNLALSRNPQAKAWVRATTILLQTYLREYIVKRYQQRTLANLTELELREAAFNMHPKAYTRGGLSLVVLLSPTMVPFIAAIPRAEFVNTNAGSSFRQLVETGVLVIPEMAGNILAAFALPAHTGSFARAAEKDRVAFQRRIQLNDRLGRLREAIKIGELDRVTWLQTISDQLSATEFPDDSLSEYAGQIVAITNARKRQIAQAYRKEIGHVSELRTHYDTYDPGWSRW